MLVSFYLFFSPINQSFIGAGDISVIKLEEQRGNSFSSPHHKGTPESSVSQQVHILLYLMRQMTFCSKATTSSSLVSMQIACPKESPCKLVKCKCSPLLWLLVAVHNLDNTVARRPPRPNPVSGDKQGIQPGTQLHSRRLNTKCRQVLLEEFLPRAQPGTDSEPSLYITWSQWK